MNIKNLIRSFDANLGRLKTDSKILVLESDDWGSLRSNKSFLESSLCIKYPTIRKSRYLQKDCLETAYDLERLFEMLKSFNNSIGKNPVITANTVMANPDFNRIKLSNFTEYYYEYFTKTLKKRDGDDSVFNLYLEGLENKIFIPQFHGREHVNIELWLDLLKKDEMFREAFDYEVWGISKDVRPDLNRSIQATLDTALNIAEESIRTGLDIFRDIFGFESKTFIANNFIFDPRLCQILFKKRVEYIQGSKYQQVPLYGKDKRVRIRHRFGEKNNYDQFFGIRNCSLEVTEGQSSVASCFNEIMMAFRMKKPAVVSMHRLNFMGALDVTNRENGLDSLAQLLEKVLKRWPDVQFMSTPELNKFLRKQENEDPNY